MTPLLACLLAPITLVGGTATAPAEHPSPLRIEGEEVPWGEFASWLVYMCGPENVEGFVLQRELERAAGAAGVELSAADLSREIEAEIEARVRDAFGGDRAAWEVELELSRLTPATYREKRLRELRQERLSAELCRARRQFDEAELRVVWEQEFGPGGISLRASRVDFPTPVLEQPPGATRDEVLELGRQARALALERAGASRARLVLGSSTFEQEREQSGGAPSEPFLSSDWPGISARDLVDLAPGELSAPLFSRGAYHLFRVDERTPHPFEEVRAEVERRARAAPIGAGESAALNAELLGGARLELLPELERAPRPDARRLDRPVFVLDGEPITRERFAEWLVPARARSLAEAFVDRHVVAQRAAEAGISVKSVEVEARVAEEIDQLVQLFHQGDREAWRADLAKKGLSEAQAYRKAHLRVEHTLLAEKLYVAQREVDDAAVRREWERRYGPGGKSLDVRLILKNLPPPPEDLLETREDLERYIAAESVKVRAQLERLRERALDGEDFGALARTYSDDPRTRDLGGRTPGRFELHTWSREVQDLLLALEPGQVSAPYEQSHQFFLFELAGVVTVPLDEVRETLQAELLAARPSQVEVAGYINRLTAAVDFQVL